MEITWYGHSCFRLTERNYATVVTDPFDSKSIGYDSLKLRSDIVTVSHDAPGHNNTDAVKGRIVQLARKKRMPKTVRRRRATPSMCLIMMGLQWPIWVT